MTRAASRGALRFAVQSALAFFLAAVSAAERAVAEDPASKQTEAKPAATLVPEAETKFAEFLQKLRNSKRSLWRIRMGREIDRVVRITGCLPGDRKSLETIAEQAVEACVGPWSLKMEGLFRTQWQPEQIPLFIDQILPQADNYARNDSSIDYRPPFEPNLWSTGLERTLNPEQLAIWQKTEAERNEALAREISEAVTLNFEKTREELRRGMATRAADVKFTLALAEDAARKLDARATCIADGAAERLRSRVEAMLRRVDEEQRRQMLKNGHFYLGPDQKDLVLQETAWSKGLEETLDAEDVRRWAESEEKQKALCAQAIAGTMIAELDRSVAFTARRVSNFNRLRSG